jgi:hypothetical protein
MHTSLAAIWVESKGLKIDTYRLCYLYKGKDCPAIEYINKDWFYLHWNKGKYYTKPLIQITTLNKLGLSTYCTPSLSISVIPKSPTETPSKGESSEKKEGSLEGCKWLGQNYI